MSRMLREKIAGEITLSDEPGELLDYINNPSSYGNFLSWLTDPLGNIGGTVYDSLVGYTP